MTDTFRSPRWLRVGLGTATVGAAAGTVIWAYLGGMGGAWPGVVGVLVLCVATLESATTHVTLEADVMAIVSNFRRRAVPREEIDSVTWQAGAGVALKLKDGAWVRLPDVGNSQSRANSIRAWIRQGKS